MPSQAIVLVEAGNSISRTELAERKSEKSGGSAGVRARGETEESGYVISIMK